MGYIPPASNTGTTKLVTYHVVKSQQLIKYQNFTALVLNYGISNTVVLEIP